MSICFLTGCKLTQNRESIQNTDHIPLETSLRLDVEDGELEMPLDQACLIASGVDSQKKMRSYQKKISALILRIEQETDVEEKNDPAVKAKIIFDWLQTNANLGVYEDDFNFKNTLNLKVGNCLSYAIRYTIICRHFDVDIKNIFVPGHIYNVLITDGTVHYFEHTHSDGIVKRGDKFNTKKKIMKDTELVAEIFLYRARNANRAEKYEQSLKYCKLALDCNPHDYRPVILLLDNYIAQKNYQEAFRYLDTYLMLHPNDKNTFQKTYHLLKRMCKKANTLQNIH